MSLMSNIQAASGLVTAPLRAVAAIPPPPFVPPFVEETHSAQFPPVAPPASSAAIVLEGADRSPQELAALAMGIEVDDVPLTNDAAVLIDDIPTLALKEPPPPAVKPPPEPEPEAKVAPEDRDHQWTEAAEQIYAEERQISGLSEPAKPAEPEAEPVEDPIPQP